MKSTKTLAVLATIAALLLAGCGNAADSKNEGSGPDKTSDACKSTAGITDDTITLGVISDLSGPVAAGGVPFSKGLEAYIDYANENLDSLGGRTVKLTVQDSQYDTEKTLAAYRTIHDDIAALPMSYGATPTAALQPLAVKDCMGVISTPGSVADQRPNVVMSGPTVEDQVINVLDWYVNAQSHPDAKVAIFAQTGPAAEAMDKAAEAAAEEWGFTIVAKQEFSPTDKSFQGQLAAITDAKPDVVLMGNQPVAPITFFGEAEAAGATWDYLGTQGSWAPAVFDLPISKAFQQKVHLAYGGPLFSAGTDETNLAQKELAARYPQDPTNSTLLIGWQIGKMMYAALTKAAEGTLNRGSIYEALSQLDIPGVADLQIKFDTAGVTPGVPYHDTAIVHMDEDTVGGLKIDVPYSTSPFISTYYDSLN